MNAVARFAGNVFLILARLMPRRIVSHCLHLLRQRPALTDRWGYHIRPIHYYEPIPDFREISAKKLEARRLPDSIAIDIPSQEIRVRSLAERFGSEIQALDHAGASGFLFLND